MKVSTVLIVDDDREIVRLIETALSAKGYNVQMAYDARQGLALALSDPPDLILLDYYLPGKDGLALLRDLRAASNLTDVPVIMITARPSSELVNEVKQYDVASFLVKPFDIDLLIERVMRFAPPSGPGGASP
ncbi:MAG TPA: response regulator [Anaerolineales bacterium]|nr:response regulator [Anaerolineales bacterium]